jgi:hypothetical protein
VVKEAVEEAVVGVGVVGEKNWGCGKTRGWWVSIWGCIMRKGEKSRES